MTGKGKPFTDEPLLPDELADWPLEQPFLLHACCGPCMAAPARQFLEEGRSFVSLFYNPNIHPAVEHERRKEYFLKLATQLGLTALAESSSDEEPWVNWAGSREDRCRMCYSRRLDKSAARTAEQGLRAFTTTLLISPWQDQALLLACGRQAGARHRVRFLYRDMRPLYRPGQQLAREAGLYRQRYCGCLPSIDDSRFSEQIKEELKALQAAEPR